MASVQLIRLHYNTVYLVESGGERVLVDTGPDYRGAWAEIRAAISGPLPGLVAVTHGHHDHAGLGHAWREAGIPVALGAADRHFSGQPAGFADREMGMLESLVRESGAPGAVVVEALSGLARRRAQLAQASTDYPAAGSRPRWPTGLRYRPYAADRELRGGELLPAGLRALSCPGHTPGNTVFVHEGEGWLFSGDQLLPDITPTPGLQLAGDGEGRFPSLPPFLESLHLLKTMGFARCYPGHGAPFDDVERTIADNIEVIEARTERFRLALAEDGPATAHALAERLYPRALQRRFWQILPAVVGHLDLLDERGVVRNDGGAWTVC